MLSELNFTIFAHQKLMPVPPSQIPRAVDLFSQEGLLMEGVFGHKIGWACVSKVQCILKMLGVLTVIK